MLFRLAALGLMLLAYGCCGGPQAAEAPLIFNVFLVNQTVENDDFVLTIEKVSMSNKETLVYLHLVDKLDGPQNEFIGNATITADDLVLSGNLNPNNDVQVTSSRILEDWILKFPALPRDTKEFAIRLPRAWAQTDDHASIPIQLPEPLTFEVRSVTLDQAVTIEGRSYRFTAVEVALFNVYLRYESADYLASLYAVTEVVLHDDQGNTFPLRGADTSLDPETGTIRWERLSFRGMPSSKVRLLTLEINGLGRMTKLPEPLAIVVPE